MKSLLVLLLASAPLLAADSPFSKIKKIDELYTQACSSCHGENLNQGSGGSLIDDQWKFGGSSEEIFKSIHDGNKQMGMEAFGKVLSDKQVRGLVIYIQEKGKEAANKKIEFPRPKEGELTKTRKESYKIETVVKDGLEIPWAIAFLPDGRKLITERPGQLRIIEADGQLNESPVAGLPNIIHHSQGGLMEVAIHPEYEKNGWVYLGFADDGRKKGKGKTKTLTAVIRGKIKDGQWTDQEWIWKADRKFYSGAGVHFGTRFVFQDGYIYFIIGERGGKMEVQDLKNPKGKIYRLHDDGREPSDNPFVGKAGAVKGLWSYGHRNPQGLAIDPRDGKIYSTEHGPRGGDELNLIKRGANYGWPVITYGMNYNGTPITSKTHQKGMEQPVHYWVPSIAVCGLDFYSGDAFPAWKNDLLVGALRQQEVRRLKIDDGEVTEEEVILKGLGRVRDVAMAPDGSIYVVLNSPDSVIRLTPSIAN